MSALPQESSEECNVRALAGALLNSEASADDVGRTQKPDHALRSIGRDDRTAIDALDRHSRNDIVDGLIAASDDPRLLHQLAGGRIELAVAHRADDRARTAP